MIISILCYSTGEVVIKEVPRKLQKLEGDILIKALGYKPSEVSYMTSEGPLHFSIETSKTSIETTLL